MKNKFVSLLVITLLLCCMFLVGCDKDSSAPTTDTSIENSEESGIQMDQYLTLYLEGLDGYGYLGTIMDLEQLKEDCKNHLITDEADLPYRHTQNATIEDYLDEVFSHLEATDFIERKSADGQLKNGDVVEVFISAPKDLQALVTVKLNPVALKYTVTGLNAFTPIDPFELINFSCKYSNGTYELGQTASSRYISPIGIATEFDGIIVDVEEGKGYCNGDIVHVSLTEEYLASIVEKYGENFFSRTEADITLNHLPELPNTKEKAKELIDSLDEICLENVNYKMKSLVDRQFECETSVEQIGTMLYYNEETHGEASGNNSFNQIVFVFKLENNENPNGWYSYLAYNNDMMIRWMLNKETATIEKGTADIYGYHLEDMDFNNTFYQSGFEHSFEYNSQSYPGCRTLDETIQAISATVTGARNCNHLVVDGALESIVSEY